MSDLFQDVLNGDIELDTPVTESDNTVVMEAYQVEDLPYLKMVNRQVILPQGSPIGQGYLCILYTNNLKESIEIMKNKDNFLSKNHYYFYYYPAFYFGQLYNRRYRYRELDKRKLMYKEVEDSVPTVHKYNKMNMAPNNTRNTYTDIFRYIEIFNSICGSFSPTKYMTYYWNFIKPVLLNTPGNYVERYVLVNIKNFKLTNKLTENLRNPLFMIYYTALKNFNLIKDLDIDFYFFNGRKIVKINPSKLDDKSYIKIRVEMKKLTNGIYNSKDIEDSTNEDNIHSEELIEEPKSVLIDKISPINVIKSTSNDPKTKEEINREENIDKKISAIVKKVQSDISNTPVTFNSSPSVTLKQVQSSIKKDVVTPNIDVNHKVDTTNKTDKIITDTIVSQAEEEINNDKALIDEIYKQIESSKPKVTNTSARDKLLMEQQKNIKIGNMTIGDIEKIKAQNIPIDEKDVSNAVTTTNKNMTKMKFVNFEKDYNEKLLKKDITSAITSFNNKSIPLYVLSVNIKDTSDELNYKDTYTILYEDSNRKRHTIKVDIPKFIDNKFLYLGGNKKVIKHQSFFYPVVKISESVVQVVTNYNKITIRRNDKKSLSNVERFKKLLKTSTTLQNMCEIGNAFVFNSNSITTVEYDGLSKVISKFVDGKDYILFNQEDAKAEALKKGIKIPNNHMYIGQENGKPIFINYNSTDEKDSVVNIMVRHLSDEDQKSFYATKPPKVLSFVEANIMAQTVKIGVLLAFWGGFTNLIKKLNTVYRLENKVPQQLNDNEDYILFKDCVFVYKTDVTKELLLSGFSSMDTKSINFIDMDKKDTYLPYLVKRYGSASIENALMNFYEFMIDPITLEILQDRNMPTDIIELIIYAVSLLGDSQYITEIHQGLSRIRSNEIIPAILYEQLAKNYILYRNSNGRKKFSVPQNCVTKTLIEQKTVENNSTLNPFLELGLTYGVSSKGFRGVNLDQAYTLEKRSFDPSMTGIIAPTSSPDGNVGVNKYLTLEPKISNLRGYADISDSKDMSKLKDVNTLSPMEISMPLSAIYDSPSRLGHAVKQSSHIIPVVKSSPVLISNGFEDTARFRLSTDFVINAEESGEIIDYDKKSNIMIARYKSGKTQAIDLAPNIVKNSNGGFFLSNVLVTELKVGDKFKKDQVLAYHKDFFTNSKYNDCKLNLGTLCKVALMSSYNTYEDGTFITEKLSREAATEMCFLKSVVIGKNSNIEFIVNKGDKVSVGDSLVQFDTSFEDESLNALLANMTSNDKETLLDTSKNNITSKYSGIIEDIKIYATVELDEMSPSLRELVSNYYKKINEKKAFLNKYDPDNKDSIVKCGILVNETSKKINPNQYGVIKGENVDDSVLIEFYIKHSEHLEIGSKIANYCGLKNTIDEIIESGYEPWSEFRPDEEISTIIASNSILNRMVPSLILVTLGNKCIIELKRKLKEIWTKRNNNYRSEMESTIYKFFSAMDKTKKNMTHYKEFFSNMSDNEFKSYFKGFFEDENAYLVLNVVDYENTLTMDDIEKAANSINIPLFEYVYLPHLTMDKKNVICTKEKVPVGYLNAKRTQQTLNAEYSYKSGSLNLSNCGDELLITKY